MAGIAITIVGAVLNAAAFTGGNYLAKYIAGDGGQAALAEKTPGLPDYKLTQPTKPRLSDIYPPSELQKQSELLFVGVGALALGYSAFRFL